MKSDITRITVIIILLVITMGTQWSTPISSVPQKKLLTSATHLSDDTLYGTYYLPEVMVTASAIDKNSETVIKSKKVVMDELPEDDNFIKELIKFKLTNIVEPTAEPGAIDSCSIK